MTVCLIAALDADTRERAARVFEGWFHRTTGVGLGDLLLTVVREHPDVVVVAADPAPSDGSGSVWVAAVGELHAAAPQLAVLVIGPPAISRGAEHWLAAHALDIGARGYLHSGKDTGARLVGAEGHQPAVELSPRELQVLQGMTEGLSNSEIAARLTLVNDAIKTHARRLFRKLGAGDRAHAVARGFHQGILR